jgi:hypothetical protein
MLRPAPVSERPALHRQPAIAFVFFSGTDQSRAVIDYDQFRIGADDCPVDL